MRPELDSNPDLYNSGAVINQLSYQANWELVIMCIDCMPIDDGYRSVYMMLVHESKWDQKL